MFQRDNCGFLKTKNRARFYIAQIILGLEFLHKKEIIYQDLKPENVLICSNGYIKLADFGASKCVQKVKKYKSFFGTADYVGNKILLIKISTRNFEKKTIQKRYRYMGHRNFDVNFL